MLCDSARFDAFLHVTRAARHNLPQREKGLETLTQLAGNEPIKASDCLGLALKQVIHFCIIPRMVDRNDSGQKRWRTKAIVACKPTCKFRVCSPRVHAL